MSPRTAGLPALVVALLLTLGAVPSAVAQEDGTSGPTAGESDPETAEDEAPADDPLVTEAESLLTELEGHSDRYQELQREIRSAQGDALAVAKIQARDQLLTFMQKKEKLVANVVQQQEAGSDTPRGRRRTLALLRELDRAIPEFLERQRDTIAALRVGLDEAPPEEARQLRDELQEAELLADEALRFYVAHLGHLEALGLPSASARERLVEILPSRAEMLAGRLELTRNRLNATRADLKNAIDDPSLEAAVRAGEDQLDAIASSLWVTCDLMKQVDLPTAKYRQMLIRSTGEITGDLLDLEVLSGLVEEASLEVTRWLERRGPGIVGRTAIFTATLVFFWVLGLVTRRVLRRFLVRSERVTELARRILLKTVARVVFLIGIVVALAQIGVNVTALLTGVGIVGFIVGFALQDTLGNFASGAMILIYRPFDVGDVVEAAGVFGTVNNTTLVSTEILTFDNQTLVVPNSKIWGDVIRNVTAQTIRRVDLTFHLAHSTDVARAEEILYAVINAHDNVLEDPAPAVHVHNLTESSVEVVVRPWARREDYWTVYWDLTREVKLRFEAEGLALAVPHRQARVGSTEPA